MCVYTPNASNTKPLRAKRLWEIHIQDMSHTDCTNERSGGGLQSKKLCRSDMCNQLLRDWVKMEFKIASV